MLLVLCALFCCITKCFGTLCLKESVQVLNKCYWLTQTNGSWHMGNSTCFIDGGQPSSFNDTDTYKAVINGVGINGSAYEVWLGIHDFDCDRCWKNYDGSNLTFFDFMGNVMNDGCWNDTNALAIIPKENFTWWERNENNTNLGMLCEKFIDINETITEGSWNQTANDNNFYTSTSIEGMHTTWFIENTNGSNASIQNTSSADRPFVHATSFPDIIPDIDEGLVAGMSLLVIGTFASCIVIVVIRRCYKKRRRKNEGVVYEEVEDAATSCSIEGSSNIKVLVARARNINKSRIEQINEEWLKQDSEIKAERNVMQPSSPKSDRRPSLPEPERMPFSKESIKSVKRIVIEDEDDEYATAEPDEDLYSLADGETKNDITPQNTAIKRPSMRKLKLQRSSAFDVEDEDPYADTPEDEYDTVNSPRDHKPITHNYGQNNDSEDEDHTYELTDDLDYDRIRNARPHIKAIHRSKSTQSLRENLSTTNSIVENCLEGNIYNESFDGDYDMLNKTRFRFTISSENYDSVILPWERGENQNEKDEEKKHEIDDLDALEKRERARSNLYSEMDSLVQTNDPNESSNQTCCGDETSSSKNTMSNDEQSMQEINGNILENKPENSETGNGIELTIIDLVQQHKTASSDSFVSSSVKSDAGKSSGSSDPDMKNPLQPLISDELSIHETNLDDDNQNLIIQNKCYGQKMGNGNIPDNKLGPNVHELEVLSSV